MTVVLLWGLATLLCIMTESFYTSMEMAIVSFNRVRLQYYVSIGSRRAKWLNWLLQHPSRLFATTLFGVNIALIVGSECSRRVYGAMEFNPNLAPLTQIFLVLIFAELAPIFAARRYAVNMAMLGAPLVYASARIMAPITYILSAICQLANRLVGGKVSDPLMFLSRDELQTILESHEGEAGGHPEADDFNVLARNIFALSSKVAADVLVPLARISTVTPNVTVSGMRQLIKAQKATFVPIVSHQRSQIVGIAFPRDYLRVADDQLLMAHARSPWFITHETSLMQIVHQFRRNRQTVAVVLNSQAQPLGVVTLDGVLEELFGKYGGGPLETPPIQSQKVLLIDRTFPADMTVVEFNKLFGLEMDAQPTETLGSLIENNLGHHPEQGDIILIDPFYLSVEEASLMDIKTVRVKTRWK